MNNLITRSTLVALLATGVVSATHAASERGPASLTGLWDASVKVGQLAVPCRFGIKVQGDSASGWFFNGSERVISTHGTVTAGHLTLEFPSYARTLDVTITADGALDGSYVPTPAGSKRQPYPFHAVRTPASTTATAPGPNIAGEWLVPASSHKAGEKAWRFIVRQSGADVDAAMLRVDGDSGALTGRWRDGRLLLSHFDGARPAVIEVTAASGDTLQVLVRATSGADMELTAYRPSDARAKGLPDAADPMLHTRLSDPSSPLQFSFPDLSGAVVANTDARFRNKVVIVDVAGSWCPNCHDEAPFLESLYKRYRARGLEIVMLSFEEAEQLSNPERLRAFVKQFGISYTVLVAGTPDEASTKLPQVVDLDAYPTTFFVARDGRVRAIHAGFAAAATGKFNVELKKEFAARVEQLLAQRVPATSLPTSGLLAAK